MAAAHPIAIIHDGIVEIPDEAKADPRFQNGAKLQLVPVTELQPMPKNDWSDWRRLEGILSDSKFDPNAELEAEKQKELQDEARWARG